MPDLTQETAWTCASNEDWTCTVHGSSQGRTYEVRWGRLYGARAEAVGAQYGWTCTCKHFQFRASAKGEDCSHIVSAMPGRCGWNFALDPGLPPGPGNACPGCGGPCVAVRVAV
jgi:hypothetical protein